MYAVVQIGSRIFRSECMTTRSVVSAKTAFAPGRTRATAPKAAANAARTNALCLIMNRLPILLGSSRSFRPMVSVFRLSSGSRVSRGGEPPLSDPCQDRRADRQNAVVEQVAGIVHRRARGLPEPEIGARNHAEHIGKI